ncbi:MAG TPA: hypothetical protein VFB74_05995 [Kribbellaceae bacterium]|nr:hypothetical protein [Kribbellaceae bacterium]
MALTDGQVDRACSPGYERHGGGLVALAHDPQRAMATLDAEVLELVAQASLTRSPFSPSSTDSAA